MTSSISTVPSALGLADTVAETSRSSDVSGIPRQLVTVQTLFRNNPSIVKHSSTATFASGKSSWNGATSGHGLPYRHRKMLQEVLWNKRKLTSCHGHLGGTHVPQVRKKKLEQDQPTLATAST